MNPDLFYLKQGLFTSFIPATSAGDHAWRAIAAQTGGTGKVFTAQLQSVLGQLRNAGYSVKMETKKSKKQIKMEINSILEELEGGEA